MNDKDSMMFVKFNEPATFNWRHFLKVLAMSPHDSSPEGEVIGVTVVGFQVDGKPALVDELAKNPILVPILDVTFDEDGVDVISVSVSNDNGSVFFVPKNHWVGKEITCALKFICK